MRSIAIVLGLLISLSVMAEDWREVEIQKIVKEAKARGYSDKDTKYAILSNDFEVPVLMLCMYVPNLEECYE